MKMQIFRGSANTIARLKDMQGFCSKGAFTKCFLRHRGYNALLIRTTAPTIRAVNVTAPPKIVLGKEKANVAKFSQFGLRNDLITVLESENILKPTEIQALAIPHIAKGGDYLLASHTGSGKTLAYLLPLIQLIKQLEEEHGFPSRPKRPKALVLGPTKELTDQINMVAKKFCHASKFRCTCVNAGKRIGIQKDVLTGPIDLVISTPTRVLQLINEDALFLGDVRWLVVDEADTIMAQGWGEEVERILRPLKAKPIPANVVFVSATLTKHIRQLFKKVLPNMEILETSTLHRAIEGSTHTFMSVPPQESRMTMLTELLTPEMRRGARVLVFCNTVNSARAAAHSLEDAGLPVAAYHGDIPVDRRKEEFAKFTEAKEPGQLVPILVATDVAARGLDFPQRIDLVVNFDFPPSSIDYIHRTGRTARAGHKGRIVSFTSKRDKQLAERIEWALRHHEPLDDIFVPQTRPAPAQQASSTPRPGRAGPASPIRSGRTESASPSTLRSGRTDYAKPSIPRAGVPESRSAAGSRDSSSRSRSSQVRSSRRAVEYERQRLTVDPKEALQGEALEEYLNRQTMLQYKEALRQERKEAAAAAKEA